MKSQVSNIYWCQSLVWIIQMDREKVIGSKRIKAHTKHNMAGLDANRIFKTQSKMYRVKSENKNKKRLYHIAISRIKNSYWVQYCFDCLDGISEQVQRYTLEK